MALLTTGCQTSVKTPTTSSTADERITILPCDDDPQGDIHFDKVTLTNGVLPEGNYSPLHPVPHQSGDPCFIIQGRIINNSKTRYWVAYHAYGYDSAGNEVSFTLDMGPIAGIAQIGIEPHSVEDFTLHLGWSGNTTAFTLHSAKSAIMFP